MKSIFSIPIRVYYQDTDAGAVVYHANYLGFMDRCRTDWVRSLAWGQSELAEKFSGLFVVRNVKMRLRLAARLDDELIVCISDIKVRRASGVFYQQIYRNEKLLCDGEIEVAWVSRESFRPQALPQLLRERMALI